MMFPPLAMGIDGKKTSSLSSNSIGIEIQSRRHLLYIASRDSVAGDLEGVSATKKGGLWSSVSLERQKKFSFLLLLSACLTSAIEG